MYKTWIEVNKAAVRKNVAAFRKFLKRTTKLWSVVKSNAYGHGLTAFAKVVDEAGADGFCVDSVIEGVKLREIGIRKPILVLGPTVVPDGFLTDAVTHNITITISTPEALDKLGRSKWQPEFHLKLDTGMHRQGFYPDDLARVIRQIRNPKSEIRNHFTGVYTHFAAAKDSTDLSFTARQFAAFERAIRILGDAGFSNLVRHVAATGGALIDPRYHLDAARIGIGLYGLWPSRELEAQNSLKIKLRPVLSWHTVVSEVKSLSGGEFIGYDLSEQTTRPTRLAVLPIGYWHGFDRGLSSVGEVLINNKRARILGRVSMDLIAVDATKAVSKVNSRATIIGRQGNEEITALEIAEKIGTSHYEIITRINPLIERLVV